MFCYANHKIMNNVHEQSTNEMERRLNPADITLQSGYKIEVFAQGLDAPSCILFTPDGDIIVGESGYVTGNPAIISIRNGNFEVLAKNFKPPLSGITYHEGDLFVSHLGTITVVNQDGSRQDVITGLPSSGDHFNSKVTFGQDEKLYFGLGTATNSGVVGLDNTWIDEFPNFCDNAGTYIMLRGQNFQTINRFSAKQEMTMTGAFSPYGVSNYPYEIRKGITKASGSILRANPDGSELEQVAWGFRFPSYVKFDANNRLFASNQGYDVRGSRPIANAPDEFCLVIQGRWYGWPDYAGGEPVTLSKFRPEGGLQPEFLLSSHPGVPLRPFSTFPSNSYVIGFDFNYNRSFGFYGDAFLAEFGGGGVLTQEAIAAYAGMGHRISRIDMNTGVATTFAMNKSGFPSPLTGEGGFGRPVEVVFGPDEAMYIVDMGTNSPTNPRQYYPNTGVIWRISRI